MGGPMVLKLYLAGGIAGGLMLAMFMPENPQVIQPRLTMSNPLNAMLAYLCVRSPYMMLNVFGFPMKATTFLLFIALQSMFFDPAFSGIASMGAGSALAYFGWIYTVFINFKYIYIL